MSAEPVSASSTASPSASRRFVWPFVLACLLVLFLAQALVSALSLTALNRLVADNTAERIELAARPPAGSIQTGLNLGKSLNQYFGLEEVLQQLEERTSGLQGAAVVLPDGQVLASVGQEFDVLSILLAITQQGATDTRQVQKTESGSVRQAEDGAVQLGIPLTDQDKTVVGALVVRVQTADAADQAMLVDTGLVMGAITLVAALALVVLLRVDAVRRGRVAGSRRRHLVPVLVVLVAQMGVAAYTTSTFRTVWLDVVQENAQTLAHNVQSDLEKVLDHGIEPDRIQGMDDYLQRVIRSFSVVGNMAVKSPDGEVLGQAGAQAADGGHDGFSLSLQANNTEVATLDVQYDEAVLRAGVWARIADAVTVALIAAIAAMELLRLLDIVIREGVANRLRHWRASARQPLPVSPRLARPIMFGFLFAWALPLGFLPLYARELLPADVSASSVQILMALPIAVEMGCGLLTALLAGRLSDKYGWHRPVVLGLMLSVLSSAACAWVDTLPGLVVARGLTGLGYGLAWMGLQGLVVLNSPASERGQNMANVIAGLFAGHLSGVAIGAMLMEQLGPEAVFSIGAVLFAVPAVMVPILVRLHGVAAIAQEQPQPAETESPAPTRPGASLSRLVFSRDFGVLLFAVIIPFSIAQIGLLNFALPLFMDAMGAKGSSVGRVLMVYGLAIIFLGPLMGRLTDRSRYRKYWIGCAGLVGSGGLLVLAISDGMVGAVLAVALLALAGCIGGGAQASYMLAMPRVQHYGLVGATSVMRAMDKVGQMLGPLVVASLFAWAGMTAGLMVTGLAYLAAAIGFLILAPAQADLPQRGG